MLDVSTLLEERSLFLLEPGQTGILSAENPDRVLLMFFRSSRGMISLNNYGLINLPEISEMYSEDELIPISALQHVLFCERQYALIHLEKVWEENRFTAEGRVLHERVDIEHHESRKLFKVEYGLAIRSLEYGLIGKADVVEFEKDSVGGYMKINPVEFKRGRKKEEAFDRVQLCAQALCLEEMFAMPVAGGQLYYLQEHRRSSLVFDLELREKTKELIKRIMEINKTSLTPPADYQKKKCDCCSLVDICMPKTLDNGGKSVARFIKGQLKIILVEGEK